MFKFLTKKKNQFKARCALSKQPLDRESTYLINTAQIITSRKFWDNVMTEPDTMSYTESYFKTGDATATNIRGMIFNKYSQEERAWPVADSMLHLFDIDESSAKADGITWWESEGKTLPELSKRSLKELGEDQIKECKLYAITEAGRSQVVDL